MRTTYYILIALLISFSSCKNNESLYFGQTPPSSEAELFAPGIVSTEHFEHSSPTFSKDLKEIYWSRIELPLTGTSKHKIVYTKLEGNKWSEVQTAAFSGINSDDGPFFHHKNNEIYFYSRKMYDPNHSVMPMHDIFLVKKKKDTWSEIEQLPEYINTEIIEVAPSFDKYGNMLFLRQKNGNPPKLKFFYQEPGNMPVQILNDSINNKYLNISPFLSPDGKFILFASVNRPEGFGNSDLYISFKKKDGSWTNPKNLGNKINTDANERFPSISPDGKYLFFVSNRSIKENQGKQDVYQNGLGDIYWINMNALEEIMK